MTFLRTQLRAAWQWLDDRTGIGALGPLVKKKEVPIHRHTMWYYLGGMVLFLFFLQIGTGVLLMIYYRPSAEEAYESVKFLMSEVEFGWLIRSIHGWGANLMIFTLFVHMFSVLLLKAYRKPREITWLTGMGLLGMGMGLGFTGYLLPWNELAFFATRVGTEIPGVVPLVGPPMKEFLRGGEDVTGATLTRFYALHVWVLPFATAALIAVHVLLVQMHGMSVPPSIEQSGGASRNMKFVPNFLLRDAIGWLAALAILAALAALIPAHLGEKADPFASAPAGIKPEWYFMFMFQTLKMLPAEILGIEGEIVGVVGFGIGGGVLALVPFLDRNPAHTRWWTWFGAATIGFILVMTIIGYTVDPTS
jgi:cytochrome b6